MTLLLSLSASPARRSTIGKRSDAVVSLKSQNLQTEIGHLKRNISKYKIQVSFELKPLKECLSRLELHLCSCNTVIRKFIRAMRYDKTEKRFFLSDTAFVLLSPSGAFFERDFNAKRKVNRN